MNEIQTVRTLDIIAAEIRFYNGCALSSAIEIGRRLAEAKEMLPHGEFGKWVQENTGHSSSSASNLMRIYEAYGADQSCLFGAEAKCQTFGNLSYSKALALLAVPEEEREDFAESHDIEAMSTRQLKEAIKERDAARAEAEGAALRIGEIESLCDRLEEQKAEAEEEAEALRRQIKELEERPIDVAVQHAEEEEISAAVDEALRELSATNAAQMEELSGKLQAAAAKQAAAEAELSKVKAELKSAKAGAKAAEEKGAASVRKEADAAKLEAEAAKREAEQLRKTLAMSDPATTEFKAHFSTAQTALAACRSALMNAPAEVQEKLKAALAALGKQLANV